MAAESSLRDFRDLKLVRWQGDLLPRQGLQQTTKIWCTFSPPPSFLVSLLPSLLPSAQEKGAHTRQNRAGEIEVEGEREQDERRRRKGEEGRGKGKGGREGETGNWRKNG